MASLAMTGRSAVFPNTADNDEYVSMTPGGGGTLKGSSSPGGAFPGFRRRSFQVSTDRVGDALLSPCSYHGMSRESREWGQKHTCRRLGQARAAVSVPPSDLFTATRRHVTSTSSRSKTRSSPASGWFASSVTVESETSITETITGSVPG